MANSVEPQTSAVEDPPEPENVSFTAEKPPAKEEMKPADPKVVEEKKEIRPMVYPKRKWRPAKNFPHPPYFQMISEALKALKERTGSSLYAIAKHIEEKHKDHLPYDFRKTLTQRLKESVAKGKLVKIKASYKLAKAATPAKKKKATPVKEEKATPAKKETAAKKKKATLAKKETAASKKKATPAKKKKATPVKKKPKTVKSPAKKKAKKASA